jgi:hypothetical protein
MKDKFLDRYKKYFPGIDLPLVFYYTDDNSVAEAMPKADEWRCLIADLARARHGCPLLFDIDSIGCSGGKRYLGFDSPTQPGFEHFLSCGIPGKIEGIRYKKTPELVKDQMKVQKPIKAPAKYIVFKRWEKLDGNDKPLAVIFFAVPDIIAALFSLANFDEVDPDTVITPTGSGCSQIVYFPYRELLSGQNRAVLGMFDLSARPYVTADILTFAVPWPKFTGMIENMDESFLITDSWDKIKKRL